MSLVTTVLFDKLICKSKYESKPVVYDWKSDLLNNKVIFEKNINETKKIKSLFTFVKEHYCYRVREISDYFQIIISQGLYKFIVIKNDSMNDKSHVYFVVNNVIKYRKTEENCDLNITINDNLLTIAVRECEKTTVYNIDEDKYLHFNEYLPKFKKINNNIIYSCSHETITLYYLTSEQIENIDVSKYGTINNCANLKDKIFMSMCYHDHGNYLTYLVIYDVSKKRFQVDYSEKKHIEFMKYNNTFILYNMYHDTFEEIIDRNDYKILFLTPDIKFEKCDVFFKFK